jgi:hypothetical protein
MILFMSNRYNIFMLHYWQEIPQITYYFVGEMPNDVIKYYNCTS